MNTQMTGRNDPCPCGSGKKYKQCCISKPKNNPVNKPSIQQIQQAIQRAWYLYQVNQLPDAEQLVAEVLKIYPNDAEALHLLGVIALKDGQIEQAILNFNKALRSAKQHYMLHANLGLAYHEQGNLVLADEHYQAAIKINPQYADAWFNQHALQIDVSKLNVSIAKLKHLIQLAPNDLDAHFSLGVLLDYIGEHEAAESYHIQVNSNTLMRARQDAWHYLQSVQSILPVVTGSMIKTFELAMQAAKQEGLVLEFGVRHGNSIRQLAKLTKQEIHGFDSFEGLPESWHQEDKGTYSTKGRLPVVSKHVKLHQGWFEDTLPEFLLENLGNVRLINIDCDLYSSTKTVLDFLANRIVSGTVIVFDEYIGNQHWREDEYKAFQEAVNAYGWRYEYLAFSFFTKQVVVRIL